MLHLLQMGLSKVLTTFPLQIQKSWQLSLLELSPCCVPTCNIVTLSLESSDIYTRIFTVQSSSPPQMLHSFLTLIFKPLIPRRPILYLLPVPPHHHLLLLAVLLCLLPPLPLTPREFFNRMLEVFEPEALNYFTFFRSILLTLSVSKNPIITHLIFSRFLDSLLCVLIAPTPGLAFSLLMPPTLVAVSSFTLGRAYPFLNSLPPLFLRLIPTLIM